MLKLTKESRKTLRFLVPVIGWLVVPLTEVKEQGRSKVGAGTKSCVLVVYVWHLRCGIVDLGGVQG